MAGVTLSGANEQLEVEGDSSHVTWSHAAGSTAGGVRTQYLEEGLGCASAGLVIFDVGEQLPALLVLGAYRQVVRVLGGSAHD